ncbi:VirK family protein [Francisella sp. TX07-6608]|uniref:VirK family protein n=1 Tax=Francisella sp. TX07-6608 TaxID=573568 RepID=UPI0008F9AD43|nr:VirK family protein [Francisella sp. TX07-6608]OIN83888.1 virK family protein [Francisella sp. TX07-6608]
MKKIITLSTLLLISLTSIAFSKKLNNYSDILNAVKDGKNITIFVDFSNCKPEIKVSGQFSPKSIMIHNDSIIFSDTHFTRNNPQYPNEPILEYVVYKINDNNVDITIDMLNTDNYNPMKHSKRITIGCQIAKDQASFFSN